MAEVEVYLPESLRSLAAMIENQPRGQVHDLNDDDEFTAVVEQCGHLWHKALGGMQAPFYLSHDEISVINRTVTNRNNRLSRGNGPEIDPNPNRLYENLRKKWVPFELCQKAEEEVWKWAEKPASFFEYMPETTPESTPSMLDSVCRLLIHLAEKEQVNTVRRRLLLCFLVEFIDERIEDIGNDNMISLLVQENLVSRGLMQYKQLTDWRKAGSKYLALANELGGWGALVFLPALARTDYESHYHPTSKDMTKEHQRRIIIQRLREKVPQAASRERRGGRNAYEVVEALREHWRSKFSTIILDCDLYGRQETSTTLNCRQYDPTTKPYRFRQSRIAKQTSHPRTPLPAMGEDVPLWQAPSSIVQSPWGDSELTPDGASTTQLSFPTSNDDDCRRVFPSSSSMPLVI